MTKGKSETISLDQAKQLLQVLIGKEAHLSCGYGGVIFLEIGNLVDQKIPRRIPRLYKGEYRLFCDETWEFMTKSGKKFGRWDDKPSSFKRDTYFSRLGIRIIEQIKVIGNFDRTEFHLNDGYVFTIVKDDALDTFVLQMFPEKKRLTVWGNGTIEFTHLHIDKGSGLVKPKFRKPLSARVSISRQTLRRWCPDYLQISLEKAQTLSETIVGQSVKEIDIDSGTKFTLQLGPTYDDQPSSSETKKRSNSLFRWYLHVSELWTLSKDGKIVLDVQKEKFHFGDALEKYLLDKKVSAISFDGIGKHLKVNFSDGFSLILQDSGRFSRWSFSDRFTGLYIASYREVGLTYRVSAPLHLYDQYKTADVHLSAIWYELDFYRAYYSAGKDSMQTINDTDQK